MGSLVPLPARDSKTRGPRQCSMTPTPSGLLHNRPPHGQPRTNLRARPMIDELVRRPNLKLIDVIDARPRNHSNRVRRAHSRREPRRQGENNRIGIPQGNSGSQPGCPSGEVHSHGRRISCSPARPSSGSQKFRRIACDTTCWRPTVGAWGEPAALVSLTRPASPAIPGLWLPSALSRSLRCCSTRSGPAPNTANRVFARRRPRSAASTGKISRSRKGNGDLLERLAEHGKVTNPCCSFDRVNRRSAQCKQRTIPMKP